MLGLMVQVSEPHPEWRAIYESALAAVGEEGSGSLPYLSPAPGLAEAVTEDSAWVASLSAAELAAGVCPAQQAAGMQCDAPDDALLMRFGELALEGDGRVRLPVHQRFRDNLSPRHSALVMTDHVFVLEDTGEGWVVVEKWLERIADYQIPQSRGP